MTLRDDYSGPFDPDLRLTDFSRSFLVRLGFEYLLIGHMLDRVGQPLVVLEEGLDGFVRSGVEEWMAASPIYSKRMQRLMQFEGDDVGTVFKNIQIEVGSPQQFMDFQFRLDSPDYGEFWLAHCGALMDVEKTGDANMTKLMCHDIEDPTFDATAAATNPRMIMRPIHRPPRINEPSGNGEGRWPHCRWSVSISSENQPYQQHPHLDVIAQRSLATVPVDFPDESHESGGFDDYARPFDPHCTLHDFSQRALVALNQEFAVQTLLLMQSYMLSQANHFGEEKAQELGRRMWVGHAAFAADRLQNYLGIEGDDLETIAKVVQLHPNFWPRTYVDLRVELAGSDCLWIGIGDCPALNEETNLSWFRQLSEEPHPALTALVQHINPRAQVRPAEPGSARLAWEVFIDPTAEPAPVPVELQLGQLSTGATFQFEHRKLLRVV